MWSNKIVISQLYDFQFLIDIFPLIWRKFLFSLFLSHIIYLKYVGFSCRNRSIHWWRIVLKCLVISMNEGNSLPQCSHLKSLSFSWYFSPIAFVTVLPWILLFFGMGPLMYLDKMRDKMRHGESFVTIFARIGFFSSMSYIETFFNVPSLFKNTCP